MFHSQTRVYNLRRRALGLAAGLVALGSISGLLSGCGGGSVNPFNNGPTAAVAVSPSAAVPVFQSITLDASGSTDPDGDTLSYAWLQTGGPGVSLYLDLVQGPDGALDSTRNPSAQLKQILRSRSYHVAVVPSREARLRTPNS